MMNPNVTQAHKQKQKSISNQNMLGMTQTGHGSIITTGQTGLGLTTFLKSNGNANTTVSSNTMMFGNNKSGIGSQQKSILHHNYNMHLSKLADEKIPANYQTKSDQPHNAQKQQLQVKNVKVLRKQPTIQNS